MEYVADWIGVMVHGRLVELGPAQAVWEGPRHPYTRALWAAVPRAEPSRRRAPVVLPGEGRAATGCVFRGRCPQAKAECAVAPGWQPVGEGHEVACWFP